jgi:hypothetical protein
VPAPAVIPAPIAYIKVAIVKKLVVEFLGLVGPVCREVCTDRPTHSSGSSQTALS